MQQNLPVGRFQGIVTGLVQFDDYLLSYLLLSKSLTSVTLCADNKCTAFMSFLNNEGTQSVFRVRVFMVGNTAMLAREPHEVGNFKGQVANSDIELHKMVEDARRGFYRGVKKIHGVDPIDIRVVMEGFYRTLHTVQSPDTPMGPPRQGPTTVRSGFKEGKKII